MTFSFIIPAYNEEALIADTLEHVRAAAESVGLAYEVIVVDDASTDQTAALARAGGAKVVSVNLRHIAAVRNAGAREAQGEFLIFVDADTWLPKETLQAALAALRAGAVGGGAHVRGDQPAGWSAELFLIIWNMISRVMRWSAGCFIFARAADFAAVGGYNEAFFASEEIVLSKAMKKRGRWVILRQPVVTSARKARMYPMRQWWWMTLKFLFRGQKMLQTRDGLDMWYEGRREPPAAGERVESRK
ncbi:MAG: glycosyltransferase [Phycisphaeraceae bacterium]|nr:glycosyltransferase [Phycisphaeraceae bacterium]